MGGNKKTILIVEDEKPMIQALREKLTDANYNVWVAENGKDGLELAKKKKPDLILLDIIMPVMDGITMLQKLRKDNWGKKVKVMILTNLSDVSKADEASDFNVLDYLIKTDWTLEDLLKKVEEAI